MTENTCGVCGGKLERALTGYYCPDCHPPDIDAVFGDWLGTQLDGICDACPRAGKNCYVQCPVGVAEAMLEQALDDASYWAKHAQYGGKWRKSNYSGSKHCESAALAVGTTGGGRGMKSRVTVSLHDDREQAWVDYTYGTARDYGLGGGIILVPYRDVHMNNYYYGAETEAAVQVALARVPALRERQCDHRGQKMTTLKPEAAAIL